MSYVGIGLFMIIISFNKTHVDFINTYFLKREHLGSRRDTLTCNYLCCFAINIIPTVVLLIIVNPMLKSRLQ